jgi:hypothetical protein
VDDARVERYLAQAQTCEQLAKVARTGDQQAAEMYEYLACQWRCLSDQVREYEICKAALERRSSRIQTTRRSQGHLGIEGPSLFSVADKRMIQFGKIRVIHGEVSCYCSDECSLRHHGTRQSLVGASQMVGIDAELAAVEQASGAL